jgi:hypothetical protein
MNTLEDSCTGLSISNNGTQLSSMARSRGPEARLSLPSKRPDPEVVPKATRRHFTIAYKRRILEEIQTFTDPGQLGALLRREGLFYSSLASFRLQLANIDKATAKACPKGDRGRSGHSGTASLAESNRKIKQLELKLKQAQMIIDVQKKLSALLGLSLDTSPEEMNSLAEVSH